MKHVPQNEMDLLLRKWSQSGQTGATELHSAHLDPDELSAYAENVLPPAARAKYTEHLLDCTTCRRIVADLAPSLVPISKREEAAPSAVRQFFSKLTSSLFLRYAVPSLAAVLILAMGFFVVNRQPGEVNKEMVAKNDAQQPSSASQVKDQSPGPEPSAPVDSPAKTAGEKSTAKPTTTAARTESTPAPTDVVASRIQAESEKRAEDERKDVARQAAAPPAPAPAAASTGASGERELAKRNVTPEKKQEPAAEVRQMKEEARKLDDYDAAANERKTKAAPQPGRASMRGASGSTDTVGRDNQNKNSTQDKDSGETRKVAGRSFKKVNGVWTDTAYDGRDTTNLSRGSEQFRALVADEPSLRTIAEQLDGQVVVLWKGRAYRIR